MLGSLALVQPVQALTLDNGLKYAGENSGYDPDQQIEDIIGTVIGIILGLLGVIFLVLTVYAGFLWMTSAGDSKKVDTAKSILVTSIIGLVITMSAYAITEFVIIQALDATSKATYTQT